MGLPTQGLPMCMNTFQQRTGEWRRRCACCITSISHDPLHYSTQCRRVFEYGSFNRMQSRMMDKVLHTNNNIVVSAPTGSGNVAVCWHHADRACASLLHRFSHLPRQDRLD